MKQKLKRREDRGQRTMQGHTISNRDCNPCSGTPSWNYIEARGSRIV